MHHFFSCTPSNYPLVAHLQLLGSPAELRCSRGTSVEDDKGRLERDVAKDVCADASAGLQPAEAAVAGARGANVHEGSRDGDGRAVGVDGKGEVGHVGVAGDGDAAGVGVLLGPLNLGVVGLDDLVGQEQQGGAGVGDARDVRLLKGAVADLEAGRGETPEALAVVDRRVGDGAGEGRLVDEAKVVCAS